MQNYFLFGISAASHLRSLRKSSFFRPPSVVVFRPSLPLLSVLSGICLYNVFPSCCRSSPPAFAAVWDPMKQPPCPPAIFSSQDMSCPSPHAHPLLLHPIEAANPQINNRKKTQQHNATPRRKPTERARYSKQIPRIKKN